jgi:hypothetical protein
MNFCRQYTGADSVLVPINKVRIRLNIRQGGHFDRIISFSGHSHSGIAFVHIFLAINFKIRRFSALETVFEMFFLWLHKKVRRRLFQCNVLSILSMPNFQKSYRIHGRVMFMFPHSRLLCCEGIGVGKSFIYYI